MCREFDQHLFATLVALRERGNDGHMDLVCITVDCAAPAAVVGFWSEALRWRDVRVAPDGSGAVCRSPVGGAYLEFIRVPEEKKVKNRLHLGCTAGDLDRLDDEIGRLEKLGATVAWEEEFPTEVAALYRNVVLRDVEGNEFCLGAGHMPSAPPAEDVVVRDARGTTAGGSSSSTRDVPTRHRRGGTGPPRVGR